MKSIFNKKKIEEECENFFNLYDVTKGRTREMCLAKQIHTHAVAENCFLFAKGEGMNEYDCDMAWVIGELHDFARFGQVIATQSYFSRTEFDHAKLGARILFAHGMITDIIKNYDEVPEEDRLVMEKAVYHHSDFKLPDDLTEREYLFCDLIRQADRTDIFRLNAESGFQTVYGHSEEEIMATDISDAVYDCFINQEMVEFSKVKTLADQHLVGVALVFGLEFPSARKRTIEQGYLKQLLDVTFSASENQEKYLKMKKSVEDFLFEYE